MPKSYLLLILLLVSIPVAYAHHECTPNTPQNCNISDSSAAPHLSGLQNCAGYTFTNVLEYPICGRTNSEIFIHNGMATGDVAVSYNGMYIGKIELVTAPTGEPHNEWIGIGGQRVDIPSWIYYETTREGTLLHKGLGYQYIAYDLIDGKYWIDPEKTYQRISNHARLLSAMYEAISNTN